MALHGLVFRSLRIDLESISQSMFDLTRICLSLFFFMIVIDEFIRLRTVYHETRGGISTKLACLRSALDSGFADLDGNQIFRVQVLVKVNFQVISDQGLEK